MNQAIRDNLNALFPDDDTTDSWTPTLDAASAAPGVSSVQGRQYRIGGMMLLWARFVISGSGVGRYSVDLPVAAVGLTGSSSAHSGHVIGVWSAADSTALAENSRGGLVHLQDADTAIFVLAGESINDARSVESDTPFVSTTPTSSPSKPSTRWHEHQPAPRVRQRVIPRTEIRIPKRGYYDISVYARWSEFEGAAPSTSLAPVRVRSFSVAAARSAGAVGIGRW